MKHLFIDTNIWLSLYHFTKDDLNQFSALKDYINKDIVLYYTEQVRDELIRNRETKIKDALSAFDMKPLKYPSFLQGFSVYSQFSSDYQKVLKDFNKWRKEIDSCISSNTLPADSTLKDIFESVDCISCDEFIDKAFSRYKKGNPPGKDNKYGDAINWECLLHTVPQDEDLYFISADKDYRSILEKDKMNPYLLSEWNEKKHSNIHFYTNLTDFLQDHLHDINLETENEKQRLIEKLADSCNFITTHGIIAMLGKFSGWTESQVESICACAENNSQVNWILEDDDIRDFYQSILLNIDINSLGDCSTKRIFDFYEEKQLPRIHEARYDAVADEADTLEEYYNH